MLTLILAAVGAIIAGVIGLAFRFGGSAILAWFTRKPPDPMQVVARRDDIITKADVDASHTSYDDVLKELDKGKT